MFEFKAYHAHVYFDAETLPQAEALCLKADDELPIKMGRIHQKNVGPHPCWSCQLSFAGEDFSTVVNWLNYHRHGLTVFIHPISDDDLKDHSDYVMWLGRSYSLDLSIFN